MKRISKNDKEWKKILSEEEFEVLRKKGTEKAFTGEYWDHKDNGDYLCRGCEAKLFSSDAKFDSGTGWPSFSDTKGLNYIELKEDLSHGMNRIEIICRKCGGHLGHLFYDGPKDRGGRRFCINSCALKFKGNHEKEK